MFVLLGVARQSLFQLSCIKAFALTLYPLLCETGSHFVALAGLELTMYIVQAALELTEIFLCLLNAGIKGVCHQAWQCPCF